jgi:RimJ/RimL family protein N-acetyltransferase
MGSVRAATAGGILRLGAMRVKHQEDPTMDGSDKNIFEGQLVRLRGVEPEDWETLFAWNQDSESARHLYFIPFPTSKEEVRQWVAKRALQRGEEDTFFFVIETLASQFVGSISSARCDRRNGTFTYGVGILPAHRRRGYATKAVVLLLTYFFRELRYQKVTAHIYSFNAPSIRLHEQLGFLREGQVRRMVYTDGHYFDEILFGMTAEEFAERYGQR